jgi:hypothetical protein
MDLLPGLELGHGHDEDEGTAAVTEVYLTGSVELQGTQISSDLVRAGLELEESLADGEFELGVGWGAGGSLDDKLGLGTFHVWSLMDEEDDPGPKGRILFGKPG